eukprot:scaffold119138_cov31-Tisochrysis_lutea.AAC.5
MPWPCVRVRFHASNVMSLVTRAKREGRTAGGGGEAGGCELVARKPRRRTAIVQRRVRSHGSPPTLVELSKVQSSVRLAENRPPTDEKPPVESVCAVDFSPGSKGGASADEGEKRSRTRGFEDFASHCEPPTSVSLLDCRNEPAAYATSPAKWRITKPELASSLQLRDSFGTIRKSSTSCFWFTARQKADSEPAGARHW